MPEQPHFIRFKGKPQEVKERMRVCGQGFNVIKNVGGGGRRRLYALQQVGTHYQERAIHVLPNTNENKKRIHNLNRGAGSSLPLPRIILIAESKDELRVVTEWIPGQSLRRYFDAVRDDKRPMISPFEAIRLHCQLVRQIRTLAAKFGIFHGDISTDNLIISPNNHRLVLIDFGSSFRLTEMKNRELGDGVARNYAAPELFLGQPANIQSEQFSCTMVFYELLTGEIAYDGMGGRIVDEIKNRELIRLRPPSQFEESRNSTLPKTVWSLIDEFVANGLALERGSRFATKGDWLSAAETILENAKYRPPKSPRNFLTNLFRWWDGQKSS